MLKLIYITNNPELAQISDASGIEHVMIDLEKNGKLQRQEGWDSFITTHRIEDIPKVKAVLRHASLLVRVNSVFDGSKEEIDEVIACGADIVMLPYFKTASEVETFIRLVDGRAKTCLLIETKEAVECLDEILSVPGIDSVHIGLNDMSHSYGLNFLFELFPLGIVDEIVEKLKKHRITDYGIGGIACLNQGLVPAEDIIVEHHRLGSSRAILSRAFCDVSNMTPDEIKTRFYEELKRIRRLESTLQYFDEEMLEYCHERFETKVKYTADMIRRKKEDAAK